MVRRPGDDALVQRRVDEGGVRQLHGRRRSSTPRSPRSTTTCASSTPTTRPPTTSIAPPAPMRSASRSTTSTRPAASTARSSTRRRRSSCAISSRCSASTSFRDGLREYLKAHAFGNATWTDLIAVLDARTPVDLAAWSQVWVEESRPSDHRHRARRSHAGRIARLAFRQADRPRPRPGLAAAAAGRDRSARRPANRHRRARRRPCRRGRGGRLAGAALRAADRRRLGLRRLRPRSDVARLPVAFGRTSPIR